MTDKQQIIDRIMRLEKELSDAESELQNCPELPPIQAEDIIPGMVFCPPPGGIHMSIVIIRISQGDQYYIGGHEANVFEAWSRPFTQNDLKNYLENNKYEKIGLLPTNFNLMRHSSETPF